MKRETPDILFKGLAKLVVIVGHEKKAKGATLHGGGSEYEYNNQVADFMIAHAKAQYPMIEIQKIMRDGVGISGAYKKALAAKPDACIELHFNAYNGKALGTETLSSIDEQDKIFAGIIHKGTCKVFNRDGLSRGVKVLSRSARGGQSLYSLPGYANCLVEPFFGDNPGEAKAAREKQKTYAEALVDAFVLWAINQGLL